MVEKSKINFSKVLSAILYSLPILFFVVCYFLIVTSGEDIFQGANRPVNLLGDALDAFNHSARLGDMYAWSVINFFDYTFSFGVDTIFRLIDVFSAVAIFYLTTFIVVGKKPGLNLKDALIFGLAFLMVILTPHGRILYAGFSAIHNYLIMILFLLLFATPYVIKIRKPEFSFPKYFPVLMIILGMVFGISSNVAPLAVIVTGIIVAIYCLAIKKIKLKKKFFLSWEFLGFLGVVVGILVSFFVGPGLNNYLSNPDYIPTYDYLAFSDLLQNPVFGVVTVFKHMVANFGRVLLPIIILAVPIFVFFIFYRKNPNYREKKFSEAEKNLLFIIGGFTIVFVCGNFQLNSPIRSLLPGYFGAMICFLIIFKHLFEEVKIKWIFPVLGVVTAVLIFGTVCVRFFFATDYVSRMKVVLEKVQKSSKQEMCLTREEIKSKGLPFVYLGQEEMLADWAVPEMVYDKSVTICGE